MRATAANLRHVDAQTATIPIKGQPVEDHNSCHQVDKRELDDSAIEVSANVAVLIPFREQDGKERTRELQQLLENLETRASTSSPNNATNFRYFIAEQSDQGNFNRGMLMNVAFERASKHFKTRSFSVIAQDCDFIPDNEMIKWYSRVGKTSPLHLANYAYCQGFGGVTVFSAEQYRTINGYSNNMWGWGGEDDDAMDRWMSHPERRVIVPSGNAQFKDVGSKEVAHRDKQRYASSMVAWTQDDKNQQWVDNGLSNLQYNMLAENAPGVLSGATRSFSNKQVFDHVLVELHEGPPSVL